MRSPSLIPTSGKVLAALDASMYGLSVADHAAWAAEQLGAPLEFLHVLERHEETAPISDLSGSIGLGASEELEKQLTELDERRGKLVQEKGRVLLEGAKQRALAAGAADVHVLQRHGGLVETLTELEAGVRLFVLGRRGESANFAKGHLGGSLERVVRAVRRPILVTSRAFKPVRQMLMAFDGSASSRRGIEIIVASPLFRQLSCHVVMVGKETDDARTEVDWARTTLQNAGLEVNASIVAGHAETAIGDYVRARDVDLVVMGAYGHSRIRSLIVGSTTTAVLRASPVPVLLLR